MPKAQCPKPNAHRPSPLAGIIVVNTRAKDQAAELSAALRYLGASVIEFPTIRIEPPTDRAPLLDAVRTAAHYDWIVLTSANGVKAFADAAAECSVGPGALGNAKICAVGASTAEKIRSFGFQVDFVPDEFTADDLVRALLQSGPVEGKRILFPRGDLARSAAANVLRKAGATVDDVLAYVNAPETPDEDRIRALFKPRTADVVTFTSPSTVKNFAAALGKSRLRLLCEKSFFASIGPVTSKVMRALGIPVNTEADPHDIPGLVAAVVSAVKNGTGKTK